MADIRVAFIGCVGEGRRSCETLLELGENVVGIFTLKPEYAADVSGAVPWEDLAARHDVPLYHVRNINNAKPVRLLRALEPDLVFCVGWTQLLRSQVLAIPRLGCIGFHASLLPRYRGRAPVNWAIIRGETETGNTMMLLDEGVDTGDIVAQRSFPIEPHDTCATIYDKVADSEVEMIRDVMPLVHAGNLPRTQQDHSRATLMPRRRPEDGLIDWSNSTGQLHDWVRALTHPYPGAFTWIGGTRVWVWRASPWRPGPGGVEAGSHRPGWWRMDASRTRLLAGTADGALVLERVQREGDDEEDGAGFAARLLPPAGAAAGEES